MITPVGVNGDIEENVFRLNAQLGMTPNVSYRRIKELEEEALDVTSNGYKMALNNAEKNLIRGKLRCLEFVW